MSTNDNAAKAAQARRPGEAAPATAPAPAKQAVPANSNPAAHSKDNPHAKARPEVAIIKRIADNGPDSLRAVILDMTHDELFVDKFVQCVKMQVMKHWKIRPDGSWWNPFLEIPANEQISALYRCAARKVLPDGYNANLVPYLGRDVKRVDVQVDYKGLVDCAVRDGIIIDADAKEFCENDDFVWDCGEVKRWVIDFRKPRGAVLGYCGWVVLPDGRKKWYPMTVDEIADVAKCARSTNIWERWGGEMSKKTVIRRMFKTLRNTPAVNALMDLDNDAYDVDAIEETPSQKVARRRAAAVRQVVGTPATTQLPAPAETPKSVEIPATPEAAPTPVEADPDVAAPAEDEPSLF